MDGAIEWSKKAAEANNSLGMFTLGTLNRYVGDHKSAFTWFTLSMGEGSDDAALEVVSALADGIGVDRDPVLSEKMLRSFAELGRVNAQYMLSDLLGPTHEGRLWLVKAGEQGHTYAQFAIGESLSRSFEWLDTANDWLSKADEQGHIGAALHLGINCEAVGEYQEAFELYSRGVDQGDTYALPHLASCYLEGKGVEKDRDEAVRLYTCAVTQTNCTHESNSALHKLREMGIDVAGLGIMVKVKGKAHRTPSCSPCSHRKEEIVFTCWRCGKPGSDDVRLSECGKCHTAKYCSVDCQRKDWRVHKTTCTAPSLG